MTIKLSTIDHGINMFVYTVVLVVYLRLLLNLNMNEIATKIHGFTKLPCCLWLFYKCPFSHVAIEVNDKKYENENCK